MKKRVAVYCEGGYQTTYNQIIGLADSLRKAGIQNVRALPLRKEIRTSCVKIYLMHDDPIKMKELKIDAVLKSRDLVNYILEEERKENKYEF